MSKGIHGPKSSSGSRHNTSPNFIMARIQGACLNTFHFQSNRLDITAVNNVRSCMGKLYKEVIPNNGTGGVRGIGFLGHY